MAFHEVLSADLVLVTGGVLTRDADATVGQAIAVKDQAFRLLGAAETYVVVP